MTEPVVLPDKLFFKIGEVKDVIGVKQHVLRYWETEFPQIKPQKTKSNQRLYRRKDVETILAIKNLLYDRKFTIEGARKYLKDEGVGPALPPPDLDAIVQKTRQEAALETKNEVEKAKRQVREFYEKQLLEIKQKLDALIAQIESKAHSSRE